ncbi:E3 ubiquitin-protein ligase AIRP2 isoform X2 [Ricinus communis]|uniref:E3 ubiquitin-protein ligase AIRP2 isoform X2 n=1 Tax=Ricinus communis TaxID=3988 RepID=UPI0007724F80|nr:E3 ubiquitin-protein ligase AIRP2 isoform X2 [Ricinus communis]|eukprot:XP_015578816.1 E3 ubiquitin-protein ligase AIRP2 isoform X2 [Ricinus communis]
MSLLVDSHTKTPSRFLRLISSMLMFSSIPRGKGGSCLQMKLAYNHLAPICLLLLQWMDCSCASLLSSFLNLFHIVVYQVCSDGKPKISSCRRKATIREFYAVILPSLQRLHGDSLELDITQENGQYVEMVVKMGLEDRRKVSDMDLDREDECGICLEPCTKMVVPSCCHAMCINCYRDWNMRSESCPFCRGSLKRVDSGDLWVLTCNSDVVDTRTVLNEDRLRFYLFINSLPKDVPDAVFLKYYEYLI